MAKFLDRWMIKALTEGANQIVNVARSNAAWSSRIPDAVTAGQAQVTPTGYEIVIQLDLKKAPEAAAFEYGSGIHATRGAKGTYKILPKNKRALAFLGGWKPENPLGAMASEKFIDYIDESDLWIFKEVDHPGVAQRAFLAPAIAAYKPNFKTKIANAFASGMKSIGKRVEIIK